MSAQNGKPVTSSKIKRGEIWLANLDPTLGAETRKTRPVVVVSSDAVGVLPIKLVAPLTEWKEKRSANLWHIRVIPDNLNKLAKISSVDTLQLRGIDTQRFVQKLGAMSPRAMQMIAASIAPVVEFEAEPKGGD